MKTIEFPHHDCNFPKNFKFGHYNQEVPVFAHDLTGIETKEYIESVYERFYAKRSFHTKLNIKSFANTNDELHVNYIAA
jgi:hypothetical protein